MSDKMHMTQYLEAMLNPDNNIRNQAEKFLLDTATVNTDVFVQLSLEIIGDKNSTASIRNMSCIVLKKVLTVFESDPIKGYKRLANQTKEHFQRSILIILAAETTSNNRDQICDLISDVASSVIMDETIPAQEKWTSLTQHLFELFATGSEESILSVFRIFDGLFSNVSSHFSSTSAHFYQLFEAGFNHASSKVKISCLECMTSLIQTLKATDVRPFKPLVVKILECVVQILQTKDEDDLQACIGFLYDICEMEPAFVKPKFDELLVIMAQVRSFSNDPNNALKTESVECLVFLLERYPKIVKENPQKLQKVIELIFLNMMEIEDEVPTEWCSPPDGFNDDFEDDDDQKIMKIGMDFIDRLMIAVGNDIMLKMMNECVTSLFSQSNWKMHHAAIMAMSQLGEYMVEKLNTDVLSIMQLISSYTQNQNPRIRYACCHLLGQFADDLNPDFQEIHHDIYFKMILPLLNDSVPRVVAHALASLTNFLENSNSVQIQPHFQFLYERIIFWVQNGISYVKEASLSTLSALCEGSGEMFFPVYDQTMNIIFNILTHSKSKVYKQLRGNAVECSTIIGKICGMERFEKYYKILIQQMIDLQNTDIEMDKFDPQKAYLLAGWQRVVIAIQDKFKPYIPLVLPKLLELAKCSYLNTNNENVKTSDSEETEISVQTIAVFLDNLDSDLFPYIGDIFDVLQIIIDSTLNDDTRIEAIKCLPGLVKIAKKSGTDTSFFSRLVNKALWGLMDKENDPQSLAEIAFTLQKVLKYMGPILFDAEINEIYTKCVNHLTKSQARRNELMDNFDKDEENQEDIDNIIDNDNQLEEDFHLEIANIIGIIFKVYKERSLSIFENVYNTLILPSIQHGKIKSQHFGLFLIDDAVEHIGSLIPEHILNQFFDITLNFSLNENLEIRQSAIFGLGIISLALGKNFEPRIESTLKLLSQAIEIPKGQDDYAKFYLTVKENAVSAFAKIVQAHVSSIPVDKVHQYLLYWLKNLPILHDHKEGIINHKMLLSLIVSPQDLLGIKNPEILKRLVEIFLRIYHKRKVCDEEMANSITLIVRKFRDDPTVSQIMQGMTFEQPEKEFLAKLLE